MAGRMARMEAESAADRAAAERGEAVILELQRLVEDNHLLTTRLGQMELDFKVSVTMMYVSPGG